MSRLICALVGFALAFTIANISRAFADEPVRRAFLVGIERYSDSGILPLSLAVGDAKDLAADLEQLGFDRKNITVASDIRTKDEFNKRFDAFLKTVKEGDFVFFFFSGHGIGIEATNTNFLLLGDLRSPFTYTKSQVSAVNRKDNNIVKLQVNSYLEGYERDEIPKSGVSVKEIEQKIAEHKPKNAIIILDACRSILAVDPGDTRKAKRDRNSGSRLVPDQDPPDGFLVLYSASFGEQAVERFNRFDRRRNSLFAEVLRSELPRPGQSLVALAERVRLMVRTIATSEGLQQEPERFPKEGGPDDVFLVGSVGAERFEIAREKCAGAQSDWEQISQLPRRESVERHIRRFDDCPTAEQARRLLVNFAENSDDAGAQPVVASTKTIDACDRLAASESDNARPPEVPGVPFEKIVADDAIAACKASIARNPRVVRFLFNLGRAHMAQANLYPADDPARQEAYSLAVLALSDAEQRGYVAALNSLAVLYDDGLGVEQDQERANELLKKAAQQGFPLAMYNLALRYQSGEKGIPRDLVQAYEWFSKAAESGTVLSAMVQSGEALWRGRGVDRNPRRAIEKLQQAAELGSKQAKLLLGIYYYFGYTISDGNDGVRPESVVPDQSLALLWLGRAAEDSDPIAQYDLAKIMEQGAGLPNKQPEIAERYWRLAAYGGNEDAEVEFADRLRLGRVLVRPENGQEEATKLLQRALSQGSVRAALRLANIYRNGEFGEAKDPLMAMKYAYLAIKLSTEADPTTADGNPFHEFAAGIMLAEMAQSGEATGPDGQPFLTKDEIDRLEKFYGKVDPATKQVKVRRLAVPLDCFAIYKISKYIWVWDWGRLESPTEPQIRSLERETSCTNNKDLRDTLAASFALSRKNKVAFADLIDQQIKTAQATVDTERGPRYRRRR